MRLIIFLMLFFLAQLMSAQSFTEAMQMPPFEGAYGSVDVADVNNDGHSDVLITGGVTKLYLNDSLGNYTEKMGTPFPEVYVSDAAFADVNNDGHPDAFIIGSILGPEAISRLYINDGLGNFTEKPTPEVVGITFGYLAFEDVDGDGDNDLLTAGYTGADLISPGEYVSNLYINDGLGNFTKKENTPFEGVVYSHVAFADVNGNGHQDVVISGEIGGFSSITKLYLNDGLGNYTENPDAPFSTRDQATVAFADFDGDGHMDVVYGSSNFFDATKLYINDGNGNFTEKAGTPFEEIYEVHDGTIAVADVNQNGHMDIFIMGFNSERVSKLYINDGEANFSEVAGTSFKSFEEGEAVFTDVNSDNYPDLFIIGEMLNGNSDTKLYINDGMVSSADDAFNQKQSHFELFPNPTRGNEFFIEYHTDKPTKISLSMYDVNGVQVSQQRETAIPGTHSYTIATNPLRSGQYIVVLNDGSTIRSKTIIVE